MKTSKEALNSVMLWFESVFDRDAASVVEVGIAAVLLQALPC